MYSLQKPWKTFRVHLGRFNGIVKIVGGENYKGMSADYNMTLWFEQEPPAEVQTVISSEWEALTEEAEAAKFKLDEDRDAAVVAAKEALLTADFADLIPAERKLWMNSQLSAEDLDALLVKYPQA